MSKPRTSRTHAQVERQAFYTPPELAASLVALAGVDSTMTVLEPSCGHGAIVREIVGRGPKLLLAGDIDAEAVNHVRETYASVKVFWGDFLFLDPKINLPLVDAVIMNPPFSDSQDVEHVLHACHFVKPGGVLVSVMSPGVTFRKTRSYVRLHEFLAACFEGTAINPLPEGTFRDVGTDVNTVVLKTYRKR